MEKYPYPPFPNAKMNKWINLRSKLCPLKSSVQVRKRLRTLEFELITLLLHWNVLSHEYVYKTMSFGG